MLSGRENILNVFMQLSVGAMSGGENLLIKKQITVEKT